ncbi:MAG: flagellar biosynthetic protein FliO [Serratia symbiotica]|nr:flagellar biosynthetic protein FliO [Serratia symbiotica]
MTSNAPVTAQVTQQPAAPALPAGSALAQVSTALGGILLLILLAAWLFRRLGCTPQVRNGKLLNLRASCQVGQRERIVVLEVDNTWLVLGVTAQQVTPLHSLPAPPHHNEAAEAAQPADFRQLIQKILKRPEKSA